MANLTLSITIKDLNLNVATPAFLRLNPMPQIPDPNWVDPGDETPQPLVDKYPNNKARVEEWLKEALLKEINKGIVLLSQDNAQRLTKDEMFM